MASRNYDPEAFGRALAEALTNLEPTTAEPVETPLDAAGDDSKPVDGAKPADS